MVKVAITFNCLNSVSILSAVLLILFSKLSHLSALLLVLESKNSHFHSSQHCSLENFQTFVFCTFILLVRVLPLPALLLVLTFTPQQVLTPNPPPSPRVPPPYRVHHHLSYPKVRGGRLGMALSMSGQLVREMNPEICYMGFSDFPLKLCKTKKNGQYFRKEIFTGNYFLA